MCTTVLWRCNSIMICRYVCVPSPVVFYHKWSVGTQEGCGCDPACPPACLSENKSLVKVGQRKRNGFMLMFAPSDNAHTHTHTRLNQSQYELWANTNAEPFNSSFRRGGNETHTANEARKEGGFVLFVLKITTDGPKISLLGLKQFHVPSPGCFRGARKWRVRAPWKPRRQTRPVSLSRNAPRVESRKQKHGAWWWSIKEFWWFTKQTKTNWNKTGNSQMASQRQRRVNYLFCLCF